MATARILRPAKTSMSSGMAQTRMWILEYAPASKRQPEPIMGWVSSRDTLNQIRLKFPTLEEAVAFADREGLVYTIETPHERAIKPKAYADNFRFDRIR